MSLQVHLAPDQLICLCEFIEVVLQKLFEDRKLPKQEVFCTINSKDLIDED